MPHRRPAARLLLIALAASAAPGCARGRAADDGARTAAVRARVVTVVSRRVQRPIEAVGSLFPFEEVTVGSEVDGRVAEVFADVGDRVERGRPLVKIVAVEHALALDEERAALEQIKVRLAAPGGSALADPRDTAEVKKAAAERTDAEQKFQRAQELFDQGLIARGTFDEAQTRFDGARAAYDMAVQNARMLRAQASQREASVALADKKLRDTVVRAPFAGQVKQRMVAPGQYVKVQTPVMVLVDTATLRARLTIPEKMAAWVAVGQPVSIQVEAYPGRSFQGKLSRLNPSVDAQTRSFEAEALLENEDGRLKPGFFARATIVSSHYDEALIVPADALRYLYGVYKVFAVDKGTLRETEVKLGARDGDAVEIVSGIQEGARVAVPVEGQELRDGAPVTPVP